MTHHDHPPLLHRGRCLLPLVVVIAELPVGSDHLLDEDACVRGSFAAAFAALTSPSLWHQDMLISDQHSTSCMLAVPPVAPAAAAAASAAVASAAAAAAGAAAAAAAAGVLRTQVTLSAAVRESREAGLQLLHLTLAGPVSDYCCGGATTTATVSLSHASNTLAWLRELFARMQGADALRRCDPGCVSYQLLGCLDAWMLGLRLGLSVANPEQRVG